MELGKSLEHRFYEEWLRLLGVFSLEKKEAHGDLLTLYSSLTGGSSEVGAGLFPQVTRNKKRGNSTRRDLGRILEKVSSLKGWNRLPREVVESPSVEVFKKCVWMGHLGDMVQW